MHRSLKSSLYFLSLWLNRLKYGCWILSCECRSPHVLTKSVMMRFKSVATLFKAFNVLRKQGNLILTLFALMASSGNLSLLYFNIEFYFCVGFGLNLFIS
jgi:hypothetical protein